MTHSGTQMQDSLWRIYRRAERPLPWQLHDGNLPWDDPAFSERMLREHLDESHSAASRQAPDRALVIDWLWQNLALEVGYHLLDVTCGPGLYAVEFARKGCRVTGVDFAPAAITYARDLAAGYDVVDRCTFIQQDVRQMAFTEAQFEAGILLYGQLTVMKKAESQALLTQIAQALRPGGRLCLELLDQDKVNKTNSNWWYTSDAGLWGDSPYLHLGERFWLEEEKIALDRFQILHLETGQLDVIELCDQTYSVAEVVGMMKTAGFKKIEIYHAWDQLPHYDAEEWVVYVGEK